MLLLANVFASANQNEKKHSLTLLEKTRKILSKSKAKIRSVITDSQYNDQKLRNTVAQAVIPYPSNQKRGLKVYCEWIRSLELMDPMDLEESIISDLLLRQFTVF